MSYSDDSVDTSVKLEIANCLGEIGAADLEVIALKEKLVKGVVLSICFFLLRMFFCVAFFCFSCISLLSYTFSPAPIYPTFPPYSISNLIILPRYLMSLHYPRFFLILFELLNPH